MNEYKVIPNKNYNANEYIKDQLDASIRGVNRLFLFAYIGGDGDNIITEDSHQKHFLPRLKIQNYNIKIDGRNFYDQSINDIIKQYEVRKISTGQGDDCTTGCLLDFDYFEKNYRIIATGMLIQEEFKKFFLIGKVTALTRVFYTFLNNQKKQNYNFLKEQQKFCNYI